MRNYWSLMCAAMCCMYAVCAELEYAISEESNVLARNKIVCAASESAPNFADLVTQFIKINARVQLLFQECEHVERNLSDVVTQVCAENVAQHERICTAFLNAYEQCMQQVFQYKNVLINDYQQQCQADIEALQRLENCFKNTVDQRMELEKRIEALVMELLPQRQSLLRESLDVSFEQLTQCSTYLADILHKQSADYHHLLSEQVAMCAEKFDHMADMFAELKDEIRMREQENEDLGKRSKNMLAQCAAASTRIVAQLCTEWQDRLCDIASHTTDNISLQAKAVYGVDQQYYDFLENLNQQAASVINAQKDLYKRAHTAYAQASSVVEVLPDTWKQKARENLQAHKIQLQSLFQEQFDDLECYYNRTHQEFSYHMETLAARIGEKMDDRDIHVASLIKSYKYKFFDELSQYVHAVAGKICELSSDYATSAHELEVLMSRVEAYVSIELCKQVEEMRYAFKQDTQLLLSEFNRDMDSMGHLVEGITQQLNAYIKAQSEWESPFGGLAEQLQVDCSELLSLCHDLNTSRENLVTAVHDEFIVILGALARLYASVQQQMGCSCEQIMGSVGAELSNLECLYAQNQGALCEKISTLTKVVVTELKVRMSQVMSNTRSAMAFAPGIESSVRNILSQAFRGMSDVQSAEIAAITNNEVEVSVMLACLCIRLETGALI